MCLEPWHRADRPTGDKPRFLHHTSQAARGLGGQPSGLANSTAPASQSRLRRETSGRHEEVMLAGPPGEGDKFPSRGHRNSWGRGPTWPVHDMGRPEERWQRAAGRDHIQKDLGIKSLCPQCQENTGSTGSRASSPCQEGHLFGTRGTGWGSQDGIRKPSWEKWQHHHGRGSKDEDEGRLRRSEP